MRTFKYIAFFTLLCLCLTACSRLGSIDGEVAKGPVINDSGFHSELEKLRDVGHKVLYIGYYDNWQVVLYSRSKSKYVAYGWNGTSLLINNESPLLREDIVKDLYRKIIPLDIHLTGIKYDYVEVIELHKEVDVVPLHLFYLPPTSLTVVRVNGRQRPVWLLPYRKYPNEGIMGVLADDGSIIESIEYTRGGYEVGS